MKSGRPNPVAVAADEGGEWLPWQTFWESRGRNPVAVHAIKFEDGSVFDTVNGWRLNSLPESQLDELLGRLKLTARVNG